MLTLTPIILTLKPINLEKSDRNLSPNTPHLGIAQSPQPIYSHGKVQLLVETLIVAYSY